MDISELGVFLFLDGVRAEANITLARDVERLGYSALWVVEEFGRDALTSCGFLLAHTQNLIIGSGIASIWSRPATNMAVAAKTAFELSRGRFILGLGVNNARDAEMRGFTYQRPIATMSSYLRTIKSVFDSPLPEGIEVSPSYVAARPLVVIAALNERMLQVAATEADGTITYFLPPEHTANVRKALGLERLILVEQAVMLESNPSKARAAIRRYVNLHLEIPFYLNLLERLGFTSDDWSDGASDRLCDAIVAWGGENQIQLRIEAHRKAGADHVCILPLDPAGGFIPDFRAIEALAPKR